MICGNHIGMSTVQPRVAAEDFEFLGRHIGEGDVVFLWILSANNDPKVFPAPERLDLTRPNIAATMTFGPGQRTAGGSPPLPSK